MAEYPLFGGGILDPGTGDGDYPLFGGGIVSVEASDKRDFYYHPKSEFLREPRLIVPGQKPTCPVKTKPEVLVFDEPTKGIDVGTKVEIYKLMKKLAEEENIAIILISSELDEIFKCANRILAMYQGRVISEFDVEKTDKKEVLNAIMGINQK